MAALGLHVRLLLAAAKSLPKHGRPIFVKNTGITFWTVRRLLSDDVKGEGEEPSIELSKPLGRKSLAEKLGSSKGGNSSSSESSSDSDSDIDGEMVSAAQNVAESLDGDTQQIKSDLLQQLRAHQQNTLEQKDAQTPKSDWGNLMGGMKIAQKPRRGRRPPRRDEGSERERRDEGSISGRYRQVASEEQGVFADIKRDVRRKTPSERGTHVVNLKLFDSPALGIFTGKSSETKVQVEVGASKFTQLQNQENIKDVTFPPENAFSEQIRWTEKGILWKFPIDNEQGLDEEAEVGFHEHVFLESEIADFPRKGPVRHFMELVVVGLSNNPYITVAEKKEHINWFRKYFDDKKHILDEVIVDKDKTIVSGEKAEMS